MSLLGAIAIGVVGLYLGLMLAVLFYFDDGQQGRYGKAELG